MWTLSGKAKYSQLNFDSAVQCEDIRCVSKSRMGKYICAIDKVDMDEIKKGLKGLYKSE